MLRFELVAIGVRQQPFTFVPSDGGCPPTIQEVHLRSLYYEPLALDTLSDGLRNLRTIMKVALKLRSWASKMQSA